MESKTKISITSLEEEIINTLLLNSGSVEELGLMRGKMGISLYFFLLAKKTKNTIYQNYAERLVDQVCDKINNIKSLDFENGIAGIGFGIEYLAQKGFLETNTNEVLAEFDEILLQSLTIKPFDKMNIFKGLLGFGIYFLSRIKNSGAKSSNVTTTVNRQILVHIVDELNEKIQVSTIFSKQTGFPFNSDLLVLFYLLTAFYQSDIFNTKVEQILKRIIDSIRENDKFLTKNFNRLLLNLGITVAKHGKLATHIAHQLDLFEISPKKIDRKKLHQELEIKKDDFFSGTISLVWIYQQLFNQTKNNLYKIEMEFWMHKAFKNYQAKNTHTYFNSTLALGLGQECFSNDLFYQFIISNIILSLITEHSTRLFS